MTVRTTASRRMRMSRWGLRMPLLVAAAVSTVVALAVVYIVVARVGGHNELLSQRSEDRGVARVLEADIARGLTHHRILSMRLLLTDEHMHAAIAKNGTVVNVGPVPPHDVRLSSVTLHLNGREAVTVVSPVEGLPDPPFAVVLLATGALVLVLGVTVITNVILTRQTRHRVSLAVDAARRISAGDFRARVGTEGPEPLRSLGQAFDNMAARLQEADSTQRQLLADLAHEIATPVHALSGYATAVLDGTITAPAAQDAIESQTARLSRLLDELAELRLLDDQRPVRSVRVDVHPVVERIVRDLAPTAPEVAVRFHLSSLTLQTDPDLLQTVVHNLVTNALRFTAPGGTVTVSTRQSAQAGTVSVRDTGPGIAPEHQTRIFDRFYRAEAARDRSQGGTGLGLAIARRAAERLGGRIDLVSTPGKGSDFRLVLPPHGPPAPASGSGA